MARVATSIRACASLRMEISMIGVSPIGTRGLGKVTVKGRSRVPLPPARMTAYLIPAPSDADPRASLDGAAQDDVGCDFETGIELGPLSVAHGVRAPLCGAPLIAGFAKRRQQGSLRERLGGDGAGIPLAHVTRLAPRRRPPPPPAVHPR